MPNGPVRHPPPTPRRILYLITDLDVGGAEKCCAQLAVGLDRRWWQPSVCSLIPPGRMSDKLEEAGVPVHSLHARRTSDAPWAIMRLVRLLNRLRPTLLHTFLFHANVIGRLGACLAGPSRVVSSIRVAERRYRYHLILENLTCRLSDKVVCVSDAVIDYTWRHAHVPRARLAGIANGIDPAAQDGVPLNRTELGVPPGAITALYVGRLDQQKGVDNLLHALALVQSINSRVHVVLAGAGPEHQSLIELARKLGVVSHAHFLGWRADVPSLMRTADFFVMPSRWEGMPNALLEAMSAGLPVIATRAEGSRQLVRDGETGILVEIDRPEELARAMLALAGDAAARTRYGHNGREVVRREFSLAQMIERYSQLYQSIVS